MCCVGRIHTTPDHLSLREAHQENPAHILLTVNIDDSLHLGDNEATSFQYMYMKLLNVLVSKFIHTLESSPTAFPLWIGTFLTLIFTRLLIESWLGNFSNHSPSFLFAEFTHTFLFFLLSYILFLWLLSAAIKTSLPKITNVLLVGFLIILTPPLIDHVISHGAGFWSFYKFDGLHGLWTRFITFFGDAPNIGITYGVRVEVALSLIFFFSYILVKTKKLFRSLLWTLLAYIFFFILGTFPSWVTLIVRGFSEGFLSISATNVAQLFLTPEKILSQTPGDLVSILNVKMSLIYALVISVGVPVLSIYLYPKKAFALIKNMRLPQSIYHGGLILVGAGLSILFAEKPINFSFFDIIAFFLLIIAVQYAWFASVIINDLFDRKIDAITNTERPLIRNIFSEYEYKILGWIFFFASLLLSGVALLIAPVFLLCYQALAWIYSAWPLRLKRVPIIATFISAVASILLFFLGYITLSPTGTLAHLPGNIITLLLVSYTLSLPIKDFKDIAGDKKDGIYTLPVLFGETKGRLIVASGIFFSFILSIWALNDASLTFWAILFGGLSFWTVATSHQWKRFKLSPRHLPLVLLFFVTLYGLVIASKLLTSL